MIISNRKLSSRSKRRSTSQNPSLIQVTQERTAEDKPGDEHIKICTDITDSIRRKWRCGGACAFKQELYMCIDSNMAETGLLAVSLLAIHSQIIRAKVAGWVAPLAYCAGQISHHLWCDRDVENNSFEFSEWLIKCPSLALRLIVVHRSRYSKEHPIQPAIFNEELGEYLQEWYCQKSPFWLQEILVSMLMTALHVIQVAILQIW